MDNTNASTQADVAEEMFLSPSQVSKFAGLSLHNTRKFILDGLPVAFKSGKFSFYKREDIIRRLDEPLGMTLSRLGLVTVDESEENETDEIVTGAESVQNEG